MKGDSVPAQGANLNCSVSSTDHPSTFIPVIGQVIGRQDGYLCLSFLDRPTGKMRREFIRYPEDVGQADRLIQRLADTQDAYYCPHLFREPTKREKSNVVERVTCAWADLDTCPPERVQIEPSIVTETSMGRYQALWLFDSPQRKEIAEGISRRIAYRYDGCDLSGWDLTQLLRIPGTPNHKYAEKPIVRILSRDNCGVWGE